MSLPIPSRVPKLPTLPYESPWRRQFIWGIRVNFNVYFFNLEIFVIRYRYTLDLQLTRCGIGSTL